MNTLHTSAPTNFFLSVRRGFIKQVVLLNCFAAVLLASCGGGGDGGGTSPVASDLSFPLRDGMHASIQQGSSINYTVSGSCQGDAHTTSSTPAPVTFNNVPALVVSNSATMQLSNCSPTLLTDFSNDFYDSNYDLIATTNSSGDYGAFTIPSNIPVSVKVGDTGKIGIIDYTDSSKTFSTGHDDISYAITADTANTAIVNVTNKSYGVNGTLTSTQQDRYRIKANGLMTPLSTDIQLTSGSVTHFILTALPDTTPPAVLFTNPSNTSTFIPHYTTVSATFSEATDPANLNASTFTLMAGTTPVPGVVTYSGNTATFTPSAYLNPNTIYKANIASGIKDLAGNAMSSTYTWQFQTAPPDTTPPSVLNIYTNPYYYGSGVNLNSTVGVDFSEPIDPASVSSANFTVTNGTTPIAGSITVSGTTATFTPSALLAPSATYTVTLSPGIKDLAGNAMNTSYSWSFPTFIPMLPIASTSPLTPDFSVATNSTVSVTFSFSIASMTGVSLTLTNGATPVLGTTTYSGNTATFTPSTPLALNTVYTATVTADVKDPAGNVVNASLSWTFQTVNPPAVVSYLVSPRPYDFGVALNSTITAPFNMAVASNTVTNKSFTLTGGSTPVSGVVTYDGVTATFTPSAPLSADTIYTATITTDVKDLAGHTMSANYSWTFQTFAGIGPFSPPPVGLWQPASGTTPATDSYVYLQSDVGDYIGSGQTHTYTKSDAALTVSANGGSISIGVNGGKIWNGEFHSMDKINPIQTGFYPGIIDTAPFYNLINRASLTWFGDGRACNFLYGWFAVDKVTYDINGTLTALDLRFEQRCSFDITALHGAIHWEQ